MRKTNIKFGNKVYKVNIPQRVTKLDETHLSILQKIYEANDKGVTISKAMLTGRKSKFSGKTTVFSWKCRLDMDEIINSNPKLFQKGRYGSRGGWGWKFVPTPLQEILAEDIKQD